MDRPILDTEDLGEGVEVDLRHRVSVRLWQQSYTVEFVGPYNAASIAAYRHMQAITADAAGYFGRAMMAGPLGVNDAAKWLSRGAAHCTEITKDHGPHREGDWTLAVYQIGEGDAVTGE